MGILRHVLVPLLVCAAAVGTTSCATSREMRPFAEETTLDGEGGALPAEWYGGLVFVSTTLNGRGPRTFVLDTGASVVLVSSRLADDLGLARVPLAPDSGGATLGGAQGTAARVREAVPIDELRTGPVAMRGVDAFVVDADLLARSIGRPIDGIVPAAAFRDVLLTIDWPARTATVGRGALPAPGEPGGEDVLPLVPRTLPSVTLAAGTAEFRVLLDTGSSEFLSVPEAAVDSIPLRSPPVETGRKATIAGAVPDRKARVAGSVRVGRHELAEPVVSIHPGDTGSAGVSLFGDFRVTFDMGHDRVRFERAAAAPIRCLPVRAIGAGMLRDAGGWTVGYVLDGSPAARAGIAVGDRVETANGIRVTEIPVAVWDVILATSDSVRLRVAGATGPREVEVPVVTLVE